MSPRNRESDDDEVAVESATRNQGDPKRRNVAGGQTAAVVATATKELVRLADQHDILASLPIKAFSCDNFKTEGAFLALLNLSPKKHGGLTTQVSNLLNMRCGFPSDYPVR